MSSQTSAPLPSITKEEISQWFTGLPDARGPAAFVKTMQEHIDENVEWTVGTPGDGELGKTFPLAGTPGVAAFDGRLTFPWRDQAPIEGLCPTSKMS